MPRAFLLTHKRYDSKATIETENKGLRSPEHVVSLAESPLRHHHPDTEMYDMSNECPDELYNLTKLAEVAVATGEILEKRRLEAASKSCNDHDDIDGDNNETPSFTYTHKLFDKSSRTPRPHLVKIEEPKAPSYAMLPQQQPHSTTSFDCQTNSSSSSSSASSTSSNEGHEHECSECGKKYSTSSNLARHRQTHRSPADKKARRCPHCDKIYVSMPAYSMHVRTHNQGCKCPYCGKCFSRPWLLQGHIRTHTGEKPFKCTICNKAFADKSNLRAHIQTHSNTKPHICGRCGKAFALKSYLYKHEESSCMRMNGRQACSSRDSTPDKNIAAASPTPVIVSIGESVIKGPDSIIRPPMLYRSTVISPNPERLLYSTIKHPSVILSSPSRFGSSVQDQPMDFSAQANRHGLGQSSGRGYSLGMAIAV